MREEEYLDQHENDSENEEPNDFPTCEPGQIMTEEEQRETNCRYNSGPCHAGDFEFQIRAENSKQQQQRRKRSDPKRHLFEAGRLDRDEVSLKSGFFCQIGSRIDYVFCEQRFAVDAFYCLLSIQREDRSLRMNDTVADLHFLLFVH